eukprot:TRINITY_DN5338_c0_g1_i1.p1 TRINITY_DN5338_c0_g1~~TRINITY_DN5338_c0_g1_i1.p1  ORF type:complete len:180 (+),score=42.27 TRINITY_DN5338_c0_g1_i1:1292-1831(+)
MDWFSFFSELREHFRKKAINPFIATEQLNLEFVLAKALKGYKQIKEKVQKVLKTLDSESKEKEERKSMLLPTTNELNRNNVMLRAHSPGICKPLTKDKFTRMATLSPGARITKNIHVKKVLPAALKHVHELAEEVKRDRVTVNDKSLAGVLTDDKMSSSKDQLLDEGNSSNQNEGIIIY